MLTLDLKKIEQQIEKLTNVVENVPDKKGLAELSASLISVSSTVQESAKEIQTCCKSVSEVTLKVTDSDLKVMSRGVAESLTPVVHGALKDVNTLTDKMDTLAKVTIEAFSGQTQAKK